MLARSSGADSNGPARGFGLPQPGAAPPSGYASHTLPSASTSTYLIIRWTNLGHSYPRGKYIINFHPGQLPYVSSRLLTSAPAAAERPRSRNGQPGQARGQDCRRPSLDQLKLSRSSLSISFSKSSSSVPQNISCRTKFIDPAQLQLLERTLRAEAAFPGSAQGQVGWSSEHPGLVEDVPAHGRGGWNQMIF